MSTGVSADRSLRRALLHAISSSDSNMLTSRRISLRASVSRLVTCSSGCVSSALTSLASRWVRGADFVCEPVGRIAVGFQQVPYPEDHLRAIGCEFVDFVAGSSG